MQCQTCTLFLVLAVAVSSHPDSSAGADALVATAPAARPATTRYVTTMRRADRTVVYKQTPSRALRMHVFLPPGWTASDRRSCVVFFFGGGFVGGEPEQFFAKADYLSGRGLVVFCPDYRQRRADQTTSEAAVEDARSAMRWIRSHENELGIDATKIVAGGGSAGGYLAAAVAWGNGPDAAGEDASISTRPAALILYNPAFASFPVTSDDGDERALRRRMLPLDDPPADGPPAVSFYGAEDRWLLRSRPTLTKLREKGYPLEMWFAENETHGFFNRTGWHEATLRETDAFLARLGLLGGAPSIAEPGPTHTLRRGAGTAGSSATRLVPDPS